MGYRLHLYLGKPEEIKRAFENDDAVPYYHVLKEVLCVERNSPFYHVFNTAKTLFPSGTDMWQKFENSEDHPVIVTKKKLYTLIDLFHKDYQQYLVHSCILDYTGRDRDIDDPELYNRCLGISSEVTDEQKKNDKNHQAFCGAEQLSREFIIQCLHGTQTHEKFMQKLEDKDILNGGDTMKEILYQLVYLYKTFSQTRMLIMTGW
ncbi:MAG: hypothetical protein NC218_01590 [Acetobacter sp.]|nr:hypothetical protein [Acetobacter sp.]